MKTMTFHSINFISFLLVATILEIPVTDSLLDGDFNDNHLYTISNTNTSNETAPVITSNINNNHDGIQHSLTHRNDDAPPVVQEAWTGNINICMFDT